MMTLYDHAKEHVILRGPYRVQGKEVIMIRNFLRNRIHRESNESRAEFVLRRQEEVEDAMERIDVAATIAVIAITCILLLGSLMYCFIQALTAPVGHYEPIRDDNGITIGWEWVAPEER